MNVIMSKLNMSIHIDPRLTAADWDLYTDLDGVDSAAKVLNESLKKAVNDGLSKSNVFNHMICVMEVFSKFGASDSDCRWLLKEILDEIFGR